jgi:hypothetical protein
MAARPELLTQALRPGHGGPSATFAFGILARGYSASDMFLAAVGLGNQEKQTATAPSGAGQSTPPRPSSRSATRA